MKKILIIGAGPLLSTTTVEIIRAEHGSDTVILTENEAIEQGILKKPNIFKLTQIPQYELPVMDLKLIDEENKANCRKGWIK